MKLRQAGRRLGPDTTHADFGLAFDPAIFTRLLTPDLEVAHAMEEIAGEFDDETKSALAKVESARIVYTAALKKLRGEAENDVASVRSHGQKLRADLERISSAANEAMSLWLSPEMERALANAQAMAAALEAINTMQKHSLTFAVMGQSEVKQ